MTCERCNGTGLRPCFTSTYPCECVTTHCDHDAEAFLAGVVVASALHACGSGGW